MKCWLRLFSLLPARSNLGSFMSGNIFSAKQRHPSPPHLPHLDLTFVCLPFVAMKDPCPASPAAQASNSPAIKEQVRNVTVIWQAWDEKVIKNHIWWYCGRLIEIKSSIKFNRAVRQWRTKAGFWPRPKLSQVQWSPAHFVFFLLWVSGCSWLTPLCTFLSRMVQCTRASEQFWTMRNF